MPGGVIWSGVQRPVARPDLRPSCVSEMQSGGSKDSGLTRLCAGSASAGQVWFWSANPGGATGRRRVRPMGRYDHDQTAAVFRPRLHRNSLCLTGKQLFRSAKEDGALAAKSAARLNSWLWCGASDARQCQNLGVCGNRPAVARQHSISLRRGASTLRAQPQRLHSIKPDCAAPAIIGIAANKTKTGHARRHSQPRYRPRRRLILRPWS